MNRQVRLLSLSMAFSAAAAWGQAPEGCIPSEVSAHAEVPSLFACAPEGEGSAASPAAPAAPTDTAYNKDFWNSRFGSHMLNDFPGFTTIAGINDSVFATDFDPTAATLYVLDSTPPQELGTYNLATGAFTTIAPSAPTVPGHNLWSGLAIHPVTGVFYASGIAGAVNVPYGLYTINPTTGAATLVGQDATSMAMIALAINCAGDLYGLDIITDSIYQIDPTDGSVTLIGPTGVNANFAQGMDFDNDTGVLYAWTYQGGGTNQFGTIDLATGDLTPLSINNPTGEYEGAIQNVCPASTLIFADGFESGDFSAWDGVEP